MIELNDLKMAAGGKTALPRDGSAGHYFAIGLAAGKS